MDRAEFERIDTNSNEKIELDELLNFAGQLQQSRGRRRLLDFVNDFEVGNWSGCWCSAVVLGWSAVVLGWSAVVLGWSGGDIGLLLGCSAGVVRCDWDGVVQSLPTAYLHTHLTHLCIHTYSASAYTPSSAISTVFMHTHLMNLI